MPIEESSKRHLRVNVKHVSRNPKPQMSRRKNPGANRRQRDCKKSGDLKVKELQQVATKAMADFKKGYDELQVNSDELKALGAKIKKLENYNRVFLLLRAKIGNGGGSITHSNIFLKKAKGPCFFNWQSCEMWSATSMGMSTSVRWDPGRTMTPAQAKYYALESCDSGEGLVLSVRTLSTNNTGSSTTCGGYDRTQYYNVYEISYQCTPKWL